MTIATVPSKILWEGIKELECGCATIKIQCVPEGVQREFETYNTTQSPNPD